MNELGGRLEIMTEGDFISPKGSIACADNPACADIHVRGGPRSPS